MTMVAEIKKPNAWDRREDEGIKPFSAFRLYLAQGVDRTIERVGVELAKSRSLVSRWGHTYDWVKRAAAWEEDQAAKRDAALADARAVDAKKWVDRERELKEAEYRVGKALIAKAEQMLQYPLARTVVEKDGKTTIIEPTNWTQQAAARMMDVGSEVGRRSMGLPTEHKVISGTGPNGEIGVAAAVVAKVVYMPMKESKPQ